MENVKEWVEFLANVVGTLGILFFLYEFYIDRKEAKKELENEKKEAIKREKQENRDFLIVRKFIFQNALARVDLSKNADTLEKLEQLLFGEFNDQDNSSQGDVIKFDAITDALLEINDEVLISLHNKEIRYLNVIPVLEDDESNSIVAEYIERINQIEKIIQEICDYLFEESLKYRSLNNNSKILKIFDDIYSIKSDVDKRSLEQNDLYTTEDSKIMFLINKTYELKNQFISALAKSDSNI